MKPQTKAQLFEIKGPGDLIRIFDLIDKENSYYLWN